VIKDLIKTEMEILEFDCDCLGLRKVGSKIVNGRDIGHKIKIIKNCKRPRCCRKEKDLLPSYVIISTFTHRSQAKS